MTNRNKIMSMKNIPFIQLINWLILPVFISGLALPSNAEIKTDNSFNHASTISAVNNVYTIDATYGRQEDTNLFHSFETFSIENGMTAKFTGPSTIKNIISRVTGGQTSFIDGTIQSTIDGANFFLVNPKGISFGPSAQLDIQGSFYASTADYLQLGETDQFLSGTTATDGLVSASPQSFGFIDANIAPIEIHGSGNSSNGNEGFSVNHSNHLCIIGGKITIDQGAVLNIKDAPESQTETEILDHNPANESIQMVSVKSSSVVLLKDSILDVSNVKTFDDILLTDNATLDAGGKTTGTIRLIGQDITFDNSICSIVNTGNDNSSSINIIGDNLFVLNQSKIIASTETDAHAASINISVRTNVTLEGIFTSLQSTSGKQTFESYQDADNYGNNGNITISADNLYIKDGAEILNRTFSLGNVGNISVNCTETIELSSKNDQLNSSRIASDACRFNKESGNAGNIDLIAKNIKLSEGARLSVSTRGTGHGGDIRLKALNDVRLYGYTVNNSKPRQGCSIFVRTYGKIIGGQAGNSGNVSIQANNIIMDDGASIKAETSSSGKGGNVELIAKQNIVIQGDVPEVSLISLSCLVNRSDEGTGNAGDLRIEANNITIKDGSWLTTQTDSIGNAGHINIIAYKTLELSGETINIRQSLDQLKDTITSAIISSARKESVGNGGNIDIQAGQLLLKDGAYIQTSTQSTGNAGIIKIHDTNTITLMGISSDNTSSRIESNTYADKDFKQNTTGTGGTVTICANHMNLLDGARISTSAIALNNSAGDAGDIDIQLDGTLRLCCINEQGADHMGKGSGIYARAWQENNGLSGAAGKISISAENILMNEHSIVSTSTNGLKDAGNIVINTTRSIHMTRSSILSESLIHLNNNQNGGLAGTITINAKNDIQLFQSAQISTDAVSSGGGKININAGNALTLLGSSITTNVHQGEGNGGDINMRTEMTLMNHGIISANADAGDGGAIFMYTRNLIQSTDSLIEATSKRGNDGTVEIKTPDMDISEKLLNLSGNFLNTVNVAKTLCDSKTQNTIQLVIKRPYATPDYSTKWYNFSSYDSLRLLTKASLDRLDSYNHLSDHFSEDVLYKMFSNDYDR